MLAYVFANINFISTDDYRPHMTAKMCCPENISGCMVNVHMVGFIHAGKLSSCERQTAFHTLTLSCVPDYVLSRNALIMTYKWRSLSIVMVGCHGMRVQV